MSTEQEIINRLVLVRQLLEQGKVILADRALDKINEDLFVMIYDKEKKERPRK